VALVVSDNRRRRMEASFLREVAEILQAELKMPLPGLVTVSGVELSRDASEARVRYTGDIAPIKQGSKGPVEGIDLYQTAWRTWEFAGGDCDDQGILIAALLALNGIEPRLRVTAESKAADFGHIYPGALLPKNASNGKFVALDATLPGNNRFGVEVPYARSLDFPA